MDVGVIGVGNMGRNHARIYSELKSVSSLGLFDVNMVVAKTLAEKHGGTADFSCRAGVFTVRAVL